MHVEREISSMEATSEDALIIEKILKLVSSSPLDAPEVISNAQLVEALNNGLQKPAYSPEYVGKRMAALGFERTRLHGGKIAYKIDIYYSLLERLAKRYNINLSLEVMIQGLMVNARVLDR